MTLTNEQLEWIVQEVVRRLRASADPQSPTTVTTEALSIDERLVTLDTLRGKLTGISHLQVGRRAVVTPAVIDYLREQNIQLVRA